MAKSEDDKLAEVVAQTVAKMLNIPAPPAKRVLLMHVVAPGMSVMIGSAAVTNPYPYEVKITVEAV